MANSKNISPRNKPRAYAYGTNDLGARSIFVERQRYDQAIFPNQMIPNFFRTWTDDRFYGIVDSKGNAVEPDTRQLKPLYYPADSQRLSYAMNFVADAWKDFADNVRSLAQQNIIYRSSPWANLSAVKAWTSIEPSYRKYIMEEVYPIFRNRFMAIENNDVSVRNLKTFMDRFDIFVQSIMLKGGPLSLSGWIEGSYTPLYASGLIIEIADDRYSEDLPKAQKFADDNFALIARLAYQYGFAIDKNIPWRLVADLRNPAMREYMGGIKIEGFDIPDETPFDCKPVFGERIGAPKAYGYSKIPGLRDVVRHINYFEIDDGEGGTKTVSGYRRYHSATGEFLLEGLTQEAMFDLFYATDYNEVWHQDMDLVSQYIYAFYNLYVSQKPYASGITLGTADCPARSFTILRETIPQADFDVMYGDLWKLKAFYVSRLAERKVQLTPRRRAHEFQQAVNIYHLTPPPHKYQSALRYIQEEFIGPYDTGSLTLRTVGDIIERKRGDIVFPNS